MVDIETLGNKSNSVIVSIAAVGFDIVTGIMYDEIFLRVNPQSCLDAGLKVDADTIIWWMNQEKSAIDFNFNKEGLNFSAALHEFYKFVETLKPSELRVWGNSARFDLGILENAYNAIKKPIPWLYKLERDVRTLVEFNPALKEIPFKGIRHNPLDDCKHQIKYCSAIYKKIQG